MNKNLFKFSQRSASNTSDKRIADAYNKGAAFDVDLITSDKKKVSAHRFVLAMFSKYLAAQIHGAGLNGLLIISLDNLSYEIVQKIVQLMYFREVSVPEDLTPKMKYALKFLKIDSTNIDESASFKTQNALPVAPQQKMVPNQKLVSTTAGLVLQQQPRIMRVENGVNISKVCSSVPGKRQRAQSTFIPRGNSDLFVAPQVTNGNSNQNVSAINLARNYPNLSISKMPRQQQQPPNVNSHPTMPHPLPAKQSNVRSMMKTTEKVPTSSLTTPNPSLVKNPSIKPNIDAMMQIPEKSSTIPNMQPQQQARPMQPLTIPKLATTITIQEVASPAEKSVILQNDNKLNEPDETEVLSNEMEIDEVRYEDEPMNGNVEVEKTPEKKGDVNSNIEQMDLRDIFPELNDNASQ